LLPIFLFEQAIGNRTFFAQFCFHGALPILIIALILGMSIARQWDQGDRSMAPSLLFSNSQRITLQNTLLLSEAIGWLSGWGLVYCQDAPSAKVALVFTGITKLLLRDLN
jgi:hypothetical protein